MLFWCLLTYYNIVKMSEGEDTKNAKNPNERNDDWKITLDMVKSDLIEKLRLKYSSNQVRDSIIGIASCTYGISLQKGKTEDEAWSDAIKRLEILENEAELNGIYQIRTGDNDEYDKHMNDMETAMEELKESEYSENCSENVYKLICKTFPYPMNEAVCRIAFLHYKKSLDEGEVREKAFRNGIDAIGKLLSK